VVDAPDAVSAILNHSKIGNKLNQEALSNLFYDNKKRPFDSPQEYMDQPVKQLKVEEGAPAGGPVSLLSGLSLNY